MNVLHINANYKKKVELSSEFIDILPKEIILFTTVQYINQIEDIKKQIEDSGKVVKMLNMRHTCYKGQILGCSNTKISEEGDVVYIGDGLFHPKAILLKNNKKVFAFNPKMNNYKILSREDVSHILKKIKGNYVKFLSSKNIGVLITTKHGQYKEKITEKLKENFKDKNFFFFIDNTYNFESLKDFNYIDMFLNSMCERIGYDDSDVQDLSILNIEDLYEIMNDKFNFDVN